VAAYHGRGDVLVELERHGFALVYDGPTLDEANSRRG